MNPMNHPTADDVILDLLVEGVEPSHENLAAAVAAYPQHRDALVQFFAAHAVQSALGPETPSDGCSAERFANIGLSRVLELHHRRTQAAQGDVGSTTSTEARLSALAKQRGLDDAALAERVGLDEPLLMKLDLRRISGPRPMELFRRLGAVLDVPPTYVIAAATGQPIASSRGNLRKARRPVQITTETFDEAIRASSLPEHAKAFWLGLPADEDVPNT